MNKNNSNFATDDSDIISIFIPMELKKRGGQTVIELPRGMPRDNQEHHYDKKLINALGKAYKWYLLLEKGKYNNLTEISHKEKLTSSYVFRLYRLNFLAPKIVESILNGTQPRTLHLRYLMTHTIPARWDEQLEEYGFNPNPTQNQPSNQLYLNQSTVTQGKEKTSC